MKGISMTGTLEVTVKVYLNSDIEPEDRDGNSSEAILEIVNAIVAGENHPNICETELVGFEPGPESNDED